MGRVEGKVAVVTGGAGGIGQEICRVLAREGASVALVDFDDKRAREVVEEIGREGGMAKHWRLDITDEAAVAEAFADVARSFGQINVLVNTAAITGTSKPAHESTEEEFDKVFAVNVKGTWLCTKHAIRQMLESGGGSIIDFSSTYGLVGNDDIPLYHATKGAVRLMAKTDAVTYAKENIRVNSLHPGSIRTPMSEAAASISPEGPEEYIRKLTEAHPVGRQGEPEDIAYGVLYLASEESRFVTGSELVIDGGYTAQ